MSQDYPQAIEYLVDRSRVFINQNSHSVIVIHGTGGANPDQTAQELGDYFRVTPLETSVHYGIDRAGVTCQYVLESDGAGGNCCLEAGHDVFWDQFHGDNLNLHAIEIECENNATNSLPLTPVQQAALFLLVAHLSKKYNIAPDHIKSHASIAPLTRAHCPGPQFPWDALRAYLKGITSMAEVCSIIDTDQFRAGASVDKCGFYSVSSLKDAGKPGQAPTGNANDIISWADREYAVYDGPDVYSNNNGMVMATLESVIKNAGLHYQVIGSTELGYQTNHLTADYIRAWLRHGYPVIIAVAEDDVFDLDLGAKPYAWDTTGFYHIIVATGIASDNNLLCHDTASVDNNGVRRGPRRYDATRLQNGLTSTTAIVMSWLQQPSDTFDPTKETSMLPATFHDDGTKLTYTPNGHYFKAGFRDEALKALEAGEDPTGWKPIENEQQVQQVEMHASSGPGARQLVNKGLLIWTQAKGVKWSAAGPEIGWCYNEVSTLEAQLKTANAEIATLKAQTPPASGAIGEAITALNAQISGLHLMKQDIDQIVQSATPLVQGLDVALVTSQNVVTKLQGH